MTDECKFPRCGCESPCDSVSAEDVREAGRMVSASVDAGGVWYDFGDEDKYPSDFVTPEWAK